ncbi:UNVERIFIED_CONTAM: hypothetical protein NCL1_13148 [Trichonephila clavipes]
MIANAAHRTHEKLGFPTWRIFLNVVDCCDNSNPLNRRDNPPSFGGALPSLRNTGIGSMSPSLSLDRGSKLPWLSYHGKPRPTVTWWREYSLLDDTYLFIPGDNLVRNELKIPELKRHDLLAVLTCQASNNNITVPASTTVTLDLNRK